MTFNRIALLALALALPLTACGGDEAADPDITVEGDVMDTTIDPAMDDAAGAMDDAGDAMGAAADDAAATMGAAADDAAATMDAAATDAADAVTTDTTGM